MGRLRDQLVALVNAAGLAVDEYEWREKKRHAARAEGEESAFRSALSLLEAHESAGAFRLRPPTLAELRAHHEAHAAHGPSGEPGEGPSWWIVQDTDNFSLDFERVEDPDLLRRCIEEDSYRASPNWRWRPATADGVACEWPEMGQKDENA